MVACAQVSATRGQTINGGKVQFPTLFRNANTTHKNFGGRELIAKVSEAASVHRKNCRKSRFGRHGMKPAGSTNGTLAEVSDEAFL